MVNPLYGYLDIMVINLIYRENCNVRINVGEEDITVRKQIGPPQHGQKTIIAWKVDVGKLRDALTHPNQSTPKTLTTGIATELCNQDTFP